MGCHGVNNALGKLLLLSDVYSGYDPKLGELWIDTRVTGLHGDDLPKLWPVPSWIWITCLQLTYDLPKDGARIHLSLGLHALEHSDEYPDRKRTSNEQPPKHRMPFPVTFWETCYPTLNSFRAQQRSMQFKDAYTLISLGPSAHHA